MTTILAFPDGDPRSINRIEVRLRYYKLGISMCLENPNANSEGRGLSHRNLFRFLVCIRLLER